MTAYEIAVRIDNFGYMNDTYEYNDQIDPEQREDNILGIAKFLEEKDDVVIAYLNRYADEDSPEETMIEAMNLIQMVKNFWKE